jgi:hypothetical protein
MRGLSGEWENHPQTATDLTLVKEKGKEEV